MELIEIFFDTNILKERKITDYSCFEFCESYSNFMDFLGTHDLIEQYKICVSEIVIEELKKQREDSYADNIQQFNNMIDSFETLHNVKKIQKTDYNTYIDGEIKKYIELEKITKVDIPRTKDHFEKIINRAISKTKPFCGKNSESDKGFKDVLQWESIIEYAIKVDTNKFILVTKNKNDFDKSLEKEFLMETGKKIEIFYEIGLLQESILISNNFKSNYDEVRIAIETEIDNGKLKDKINEIVISYYEIKINDIDCYSDLIDQGNNYYKFDVFCDKESDEKQFKIDCRITNDYDLIIDGAVICI
ncbi:MAG: PIN domain-containing protein [Bacilli bacterium]|nr:PIN domain-containing protein [Bacilli bacterium]